MDKIIKLIKKSKKIALVGHEKPDGDALGAVIGLSLFLLNNSYEVTTIILDEIPQKYKSIINININNSINIDEINSCDCLIILDSARADRVNLPKSIPLEDIKIPIINMDHHIDNSINATINYVDANAAAASQIVTNLVKTLEETCNLVVSKECAEMLYLGIVSDTGSFKFTNTNSDTFMAASYLFTKDIDAEKIMNIIYFSKNINQLYFENALLSKYLRIECDGKYLYAIIPQVLLEEYNFNMRDGDNIVEYLREIDSAIIVALIYQRADCIKVSLRSKNCNFPVGPIARKFGGGGHEMAAGISFFDSSFAEIEANLLNEIKESLN